MMGYEGRCVLLDDAGEWVNIPFVVREFMKQLNDESQASRALVEALRHEQKETNQLLRRVVQKQADLEMDNTRNMLSLGHRAAQDSADKRQAEHILSLRKKTERLDDKVQRLCAAVDQMSQPTLPAACANGALDEVKGLVTRLADNAESTERLLKSHMAAAAEAHRSTESLVSAATLAGVAETQSAMQLRLTDSAARQSSTERSVQDLHVAVNAVKEVSLHLRQKCSELSQSVETDRKESKSRLASCFQTVERLAELCAAQHAELEGRLKRTSDALHTSDTRSRDEAKSLYAELRSLVKEGQDQTHQRCLELAEELRAVKEQQRRLTEQNEAVLHESEATAQRSARQAKDTATRLASVEADVKELGSTFVTRRDFQKEQRQVQDALDAARATASGATAALQSQLQQADASIKAIRAEQGEDNDWLHIELGRVGTAVGYASQQREKQERQVTSLCEIVHNLSVAVEVLQQGRKPGPTAPSPPAAAARTPSGSPEVGEGSAIPDAWVEWRSAFVADVEARLTAAATATAPPPAPPPALERVSQQLNELSAKVDGGAKYTQAIISQQVDHVRHAVKDEVAQQLQSHAALREVAPALIEVEAVKRRVAGVEHEVQTLSARADRWHASSDASGGLSSAEPTLRRLVALEETVGVSGRRLQELGEHVADIDQRDHRLARGAREMEAQLQEQQRLALKLGADLTAALEGLLRTEQSLSQHQSSTTLQLAEVHLSLERWRGEFASMQSAAAASAERPSGASEDGSGACDSGADGPLTSLQGDVAHLAATVERLSARLTQLAADCDGVRGEAAVTAAGASESRDELNRRLDDGESAQRETLASLRAVGGRLEVVEARVSELLSASAMKAESQETDAAAVRRCVDEVAQCHERLSAFQRVLDTHPCRPSSDVVAAGNTGADVQGEEVHRLKEQLERVLADMPASVSAQVRAELRSAEPFLTDSAAAAASARCDDALAAFSGSVAVAEAAAAERLASVQAAVDHLRESVAKRDSRDAEAERALRAAVNDIHALEVVHSELRRDVEQARLAQEAHQRVVALQLEGRPVEPRDSAAALSDDVRAAWKAEVMETVQDTYYTRALLEERLENIWSSMISLLARKEDVGAVHDKLSGLHRLVQEELQIELERLEEQLANQLAEKVSLSNLQDILERHVIDSSTDSDDTAAR
ncbi:hypothetical protein NESM_000777900 [Novymonas esmeraldas]|uniref:Uncharacterized protein n=1 Tax=Novymonas esmeraldas TaxID=1808958 RepID=A0AAW0EWM2_9TRYP